MAEKKNKGYVRNICPKCGFEYLKWEDKNEVLSRLKERAEILLNKHRKKAFTTCPEDCLCWELEGLIMFFEEAQK